MKIIHTADIHLDSPLVGVADAKLRRAELLKAFSNMVQYAVNNNVQAIIVAGDLFDGNVTVSTINTVTDIINGVPNIAWFVLCGNHSSSLPYGKLASNCNNVHLFGNTWTSYKLDNVVICGRELDGAYNGAPQLYASNYNVVVLHGDVDNDSYGFIDKKMLANLPINYVALGHRHRFESHRFGNTVACYSGVLEARGFDESEPTGFVLIDTDTDKREFVRQAIRRVVSYTVDVTGITSDVALENKLGNILAEESNRNYVNVEFVGQADETLHVEMVTNNLLANKYFALRVVNNTTPTCDLEKLSAEVSLRGQFVKLANDIPDEQLRNEVIRMGLNALEGNLC